MEELKNDFRPLLSANEAAEFLKVSAATLWRARSAGKVNFYRIGNLVRYSVNDLLAFAESGRNETAINQPPRR